jgi:hypothetical protein
MAEPAPASKENIKWKLGIPLIILGILVMLVIEFNNRANDLHRLEDERSLVVDRLLEQEGTKAALLTQIAYATSDRAVVEWARESAKMKQPGDQVVVLIPPGSGTPTPTPAPTAIPEDKNNLEHWWDLFFSDQKP